MIDSDVADDGDAGPARDSTRTSLQFHNFHANESLESGRERDTGGFFGSSSGSAEGGLSSKKYLWSIDYYSQFFNVNSDTVSERLLNAVSLVVGDTDRPLSDSDRCFR